MTSRPRFKISRPKYLFKCVFVCKFKINNYLDAVYRFMISEN